jgi:hypothetical protein
MDDILLIAFPANGDLWAMLLIDHMVHTYCNKSTSLLQDNCCQREKTDEADIEWTSGNGFMNTTQKHSTK